MLRHPFRGLLRMAASAGCLTLFGGVARFGKSRYSKEGEAAARRGHSLFRAGFAAASPLQARPGEWYGSVVRVNCRGQATGTAVAGKRTAASPDCLTLFGGVARFGKSRYSKEGEAAAGRGGSAGRNWFRRCLAPTRPVKWYGSIVQVNCRGRQSGRPWLGNGRLPLPIASPLHRYFIDFSTCTMVSNCCWQARAARIGCRRPMAEGGW